MRRGERRKSTINIREHYSFTFVNVTSLTRSSSLPARKITTVSVAPIFMSRTRRRLVSTMLFQSRHFWDNTIEYNRFYRLNVLTKVLWLHTYVHNIFTVHVYVHEYEQRPNLLVSIKRDRIFCRNTLVCVLHFLNCYCDVYYVYIYIYELLQIIRILLTTD